MSVMNTLKRILPPLIVLVDSEFLRRKEISTVLQVIGYRDYFLEQKTTDELIAGFQDDDVYGIKCAIEENFHHSFGPTLVIRGDRGDSPAKVTVPWHNIKGIIELSEEIKFGIGFSKPLKASPPDPA